MKKFFLVLLVVLLSCVNQGSEIGNPLPTDTLKDTIDNYIYISVEELSFLDSLKDTLTVETLRSLKNSERLDSMLVKSFNHYYFK